MPEAQQPTAEQEQHFKTLAVRVEESLHAQLRFIAQLRDSSLADEIRGAIEARVAAAQDDPDLIAKAERVRGEIEREAAARRDAISGFFGKTAVAATTTGGTRPRRGAKPSGE